MDEYTLLAHIGRVMEEPVPPGAIADVFSRKMKPARVEMSVMQKGICWNHEHEAFGMPIEECEEPECVLEHLEMLLK